jgi:hypothetical protein
MFELHVLIPVADNDGAAFPPAHHHTFETFLLERFGGYTRFPRAAIGAWVGAGVTYRDRTRIYCVALATILDAGKIADVVTFAKSHYRQEAIYVRYLGHSEIL